MTNQRGAEKPMDPDSREPVTEDRELPRMPAPSRITEAAVGDEEAEGPRMDPTEEIREGREPSPPGQRRGRESQEEARKGERMRPHAEAGAERADARPPLDDQEPPEDEQETSHEAGEGYVLLRVVGSEGRWRVEGRKEVEGPLAVPDRLRHGWAWEVRYGGERLGLGLVPDLGTIRGFPDPEGRPGLEGHHLAEPREIEFVARIPAGAMRDVEVEELEIELYRVEEPPAEAVGPRPLGEQFPDRVTRVSGGPEPRQD